MHRGFGFGGSSTLARHYTDCLREGLEEIYEKAELRVMGHAESKFGFRARPLGRP